MRRQKEYELIIDRSVLYTLKTKDLIYISCIVHRDDHTSILQAGVWSRVKLSISKALLWLAKKRWKYSGSEGLCPFFQNSVTSGYMLSVVTFSNPILAHWLPGTRTGLLLSKYATYKHMVVLCCDCRQRIALHCNMHLRYHIKCG